MHFPISNFLVRFLGCQIAFLIGRVRIDREPGDTFTRKILLQLLHVAAAVMFFHERALGIEPLEHDIFSFEVGK